MGQIYSFCKSWVVCALGDGFDGWWRIALTHRLLCSCTVQYSTVCTVLCVLDKVSQSVSQAQVRKRKCTTLKAQSRHWRGLFPPLAIRWGVTATMMGDDDGSWMSGWTAGAEPSCAWDETAQHTSFQGTNAQLLYSTVLVLVLVLYCNCNRDHFWSW